ncbi:MAG TPA: hypothetical protein VJ803_04780 [Gemmatimonadaceae bacterium]|nr:hypothetical protein [Gemmatimonadaceae bacterium]
MFPAPPSSRTAHTPSPWPAIALAVLAMGGCGGRIDEAEARGTIVADTDRAAHDTDAPTAVRRLTGDDATHVRMRNVYFRLSDRIVLHVRRLTGEMRATTPGAPINFDDSRSFSIAIDSAEVGMSEAALSALLNEHVFAYRGAPLRRIRVTMENGNVVQSGVLRKAMSVPFTITSTVSAMPDGTIRLHPVKTRIMGIGARGLMQALDIELEDVIDVTKARGVTVRGNDLYLDPDSLLPPPRISGRVVAVRVEGRSLVQTFAQTRRSRAEQAAEGGDGRGNYMYYRGGTLRFGKLFMVDADMRIVDADTSDPFDFSLDRYNEQLVRGYSVTLPSLGLEVHMPDLADAATGGPKVAAAPRRP